MKRKRKFVVWLSNHADSRDDEWVAVFATSASEAWRKVRNDGLFDDRRFSIGSLGQVMTATQFRKEMGFGA